MPIPQRVVDYFAIVGCSSEEHKNSGSGSDRLGVFSKQFPPTVLTRFPKIDHADAEFPRDLPMFCFPKGLSLVNSPEELVSTHCFALTEEDGSRVYGAALTFHIPYQVPVNFRSSSRRLLNLELKNSSDISASEDISWMLPKSIVLISHWPFYENMLKFLLIIYSIATSNTSVNVPIERAIANLIMETPLPPRGRISVRLFCYNQEIIFKRPPPNEMPLLNLNFSQVFKYLSVDNILIVFAGMLTERKILFVSDHIHRLAESLEVLTYLLFPFYWRHIYIPVLPKKLVDFVCAPMPFIMGIHRSYIPDELMLSGVFLIDLDNNSILSDQEGGLLHRIPDKSGSKLLRGLKKLTGVDSSLQMHKDSSIDVNRCMECFRNYHVSIMKTYRDFMEAPSEFVVDKFRKNQFLQAHPEKCEFLSDFLSTQLFQCFVDDRYGHSANNLEVLFFDECIDKDSGKGTAFLTDTSNIHKEAHDVIDPNPSGGETIQQFTYSTCFPPTLDEDKFLPIREVAQLFDPTKESEAMKNGMSGIAMKFFTDKNKYSRQFHSLKIRSSKQDSAFRKLLTYASLHQKFLDLGHLEFGKLSTKLLGQDIAETGTTVDQALLGMMNHIEERQHLDQTIVPMMNQKFSIPILMKASEIENDLKTLFSEAQQLDNEASRGKFLVDDAKNRYSRLRAQYINLENTARYFEPTVHELNRRIALEVDVSNHLFKKLQAETMFRGIVGHYEKRMPLIIEDIRRLNGERISVLKKCMEEYVSLYKEWVAGMNASINAFQELVSQVDVDKDIKTFSEGKLDFLQLRERGLREDNLDDEMETSFLESTQSSNGMLSSFKNSILERKPKYSLDLWGPEGLQVVASQALQSRRELKQIYNELENYADVMEWRSKAIEKITRSLPQSLEFGQSQNFLLCSLYDLTRNQCNWLKSVVIDIRGIAGSLRVVKGVIKSLSSVLISHRDHNAQELELSLESLNRAKEKRDRLANEYKSLENSIDTVPDSSKLSRIEAARGAALQAEKKLHFSKRNLQKLQLNNDLSFAYILNMFESKEMRKRLSVKSCFQKLIKLLTSLYRNIQKQHEDILTKAQALDPELDIREFVRRTYNDEPCTSFHLPEETDVDLGYHLADLYGSASSRATIAEHCKVLLHTGYSYVRALCAFFEENAKLEEDSCKQIRKFSWNIHTDLQCSMLVACETWDNFVINLSHSFEKYALAFRSLVISEMSNLLTEYKGEMETIIKKFVKINREVEPMYVAKDKAENDAKKTASGLSNLKEKLNRTFVSNSDKDKTKKVIPLPFQASSDKIAQKIHSAEIEAQSAKRDLQTAVHILEKTREKEISQVYELAQMTKNLEFRRVERIKVIISSLAQIFAEFDNAIKEDLDMLNSNTESIDPQKDIDVFIQRSSVGISPPEWVLEDFHRQLVEEMEEKAERNLVSNRSSLSNFGETKDTFASRTMASEIFNALSTHEKLSTNVFSPKSEVLPSSPVSTLKLLSMRFGQVTKKVSIRSKEASLERKKHESSSLLGASQSIRKKPLPSIPLAPEDFTSPVLAENNQSSIRWRQHLDASSGEFYYEDLNSGQTTWDIPSEEFYPYENFES